MGSKKKTLCSLCRWTFNSGKGGFTPGDIRPNWSTSKLDNVGIIEIIRTKIAPRIPDTIQLGYEAHYNNEIDEKSAPAVADALVGAKMHLAMITPGLHSHFGYGGICSLDPSERSRAAEISQGAVDLAYGPLLKAWSKTPGEEPTLVLWNGSYGYDLATVAVQKMYQNLKQGIADLCKYEQKKGDKLYVGIEPKPNEGHSAMLLPTVASVLLLWKKLEKDYGISIARKGTNKETGHSEMIGLDAIYDTVEEIDNDALVHVHLNSQGYNDGITLGGPGKFDIDHGVKICGFNIAMAGLYIRNNYERWFGHDMQARPYDNEEQAIDRVIRSILGWEACMYAAEKFDYNRLETSLVARETGQAEDMMRNAVVTAQTRFNELYKG
jgi:xylose isomerase